MNAPPKREMGMLEWYATEGGRKCPRCGRYAKAETLGDLSFYTAPPIVARITTFGHLPGYGCNQSQRNEAVLCLKSVLPDMIRDQRLSNRISDLEAVIRQTIMENLHLADGDVCTLKRLKDSIGFDEHNAEVCQPEGAKNL